MISMSICSWPCTISLLLPLFPMAMWIVLQLCVPSRQQALLACTRVVGMPTSSSICLELQRCLYRLQAALLALDLRNKIKSLLLRQRKRDCNILCFIFLFNTIYCVFT